MTQAGARHSAVTTPAPGESGELRRGIGRPGFIVLGIGGLIGTGALFSGVGMAAVAGPAMILAWVIGAIIYAFVGFTYMDMSARFPEAGGPARYALYTHGEGTNLINAVGSLIWYVFIPPIEALATVEGLAHFDTGLLNAKGDPTIAGSLVAVGLMVVFVPCNYFGIRAFQWITNALGGAKILLYVALAAAVAIVLSRGVNFTRFGGFAPFGASGVLAAVPVAMFAFGGIRVLPDFAEEVRDPKHLRSTILISVIGQSLIYILFGVAFIGALSWSKLGVKAGHWGSLTAVSGNPFILLTTHRSVAVLLGLAIVVGILGPFVDGYVYQGSGSRVLMAMGRSGSMPKSMRQTDRHAIPLAALLVITVIGAIIAFLAAPVPTIYSLINDSVVAGYISFAVTPIAMLALRRQKGQRISPFAAVTAGVGFAGASLIVYWSGWPSVPYAVILSAILVLVIAIVTKTSDWTKAIWYVAWVAFLTLMAGIGSVGKANVISFDWSTVIVAVASIALFLPWGVRSRLPKLGGLDATDPHGIPAVSGGGEGAGAGAGAPV
jgi:amino acid transporter